MSALWIEAIVTVAKWLLTAAICCAGLTIIFELISLWLGPI